MANKFELFRSLIKSLDNQVEATITGSIPEWVSGTLFRNGPGRFEFGDQAYGHLFDGHACIHKYQIKDGKVFYFNKLLETKSLKKSLDDNRPNKNFGTPDVCSTLFGRVKSLFTVDSGVLDNTNVNIVPFAFKQLYALTETSYLLQVDPNSLDVSKRLSVNKVFPSSSTLVAHPHVEADGSWIDMGMNRALPGYEFIRYDGSALKDPSLNNILDTGKVIASIPSSSSLGMSYFHSFGLSENYIIFLEQSVKFSFTSYATGILLNKPMSEAFYTDPAWNTRIHLINRKTGEIVQQKMHTDPLFVFHHINAYEQEIDGKTQIIADLCAYSADHFDLKKLKYEDMFTDRLCDKECLKSLARRITIPLELATVSAESVYCNIKDINSDVVIELPTFNYSNNNTKPYKYLFGLNFYKKPFSVVKINVENPAETWEYKYERNGVTDLPSEPVFVENPNPESEDDGVLLVMVLAADNDYLSILDARNLTEIARATLPTEAKGSFTFHGFFADDAHYKALN